MTTRSVAASAAPRVEVPPRPAPDAASTDSAAAASPSPAWLLSAVPVRNNAAREETRGQELYLAVPLRRRWWMKPPWSWVLHVRPDRGYLLDPLGQEVWAACDGDTDVETISDRFARRHQLRFHEARVCVSTFLRTLVERKLIVLVTPDEASDREGFGTGGGA